MSEQAPRAPGADPSAANVLITVVASLASVVVALTAVSAWQHVNGPWGSFLAFLAVTVALALVSVPVYDRGAFSFAGAGMLAIGFTFGIGAAVIVGALMGIINLVRRRGRLNRGIFDSSQWALAAGTAAAVYHAFGEHHSTWARLAPAVAAGLAFFAVNLGLLTSAMSLAEGVSPLLIFRERFRWIVPYHLSSAPLALTLIIAYEKMGAVGLFAFAAPPAFMMYSIQQYLAKTRRSVEEVRQANAELETANADLGDLFKFATGLTSQAHDAHALAEYAETAIEQLVGGRARIKLGPFDVGSGTPLVSGGEVVGELRVEGGDHERWDRLRDAIVPQLGTAFGSAALVEQVRKTHLETIAALSRSMAAKDYYTGEHTERVSGIAVALASRLGYSGADLDAIEIGALLHDIGKIGIPEGILQKPGPLNEDEWEMMKQHPVISEFILSGVDLPPIVRQIARHSHERMDGAGYPDGLAGEEIPLPARIVLVADAFDALTSTRAYRPSRRPRAALDEIIAHSGTQFCPTVVDTIELVYREEPGLLGAAELSVVA
jgi:putative nucleotidyltransferase with HDIG domain